MANVSLLSTPNKGSAEQACIDEGSQLNQMICVSIRDRLGKSTKKRCFDVSFLISFSTGKTGPSFPKGNKIMPPHKSMSMKTYNVLILKRFSNYFHTVKEIKFLLLKMNRQ